MAVDTSQSQAALQALQGFQMPTEDSLLGAAQSKYGVQDLQAKVNNYRTLTNNLTGAVAAVDPSVTGRTSGSLVTEGQRSALVNRERAPVIGQLGTANQGLSMASGDLNTANNNVRGDVSAGMTSAQNKYNQLKDNYSIANSREQQQADAERQAAAAAEQQRQFNVSSAQKAYSSSGGGSSASNNPAAGYSVKQLSSGNKAYTGPNGQTNLYQFAAAQAGGDPAGTYNIIKQQLASGSATDKGAYNGILKLEKQGLSQDQIIARLKASNGYIFN